jgi:hypothetical protein
MPRFKLALSSTVKAGDEDSAFEKMWDSLDEESRRLCRRLHTDGLLDEKAVRLGDVWAVTFKAEW